MAARIPKLRMRLLVAALLVLPAPCLVAANKEAPETPVQAARAPCLSTSCYTIDPARRMRATGYPWDHEIQIALPPSYRKSDRNYPVLWVTDGSFQFSSAVELLSALAGVVPEMIVVGVGAPPEAHNEVWMRRNYDFTPKITSESFQGFGGDLLRQELQRGRAYAREHGILSAERLGGAPAFLEFLIDTVRPVLSKDYRMSDDHTLFGHSGGGVFCVYALLARPAAFQKYVCGSPSLYVGDFELFRMEERYAAEHRDLAARVFFGAGEGEVIESGISLWGTVSSMSRMAEILSARKYPSLKMQVRIFPGEQHVSAEHLNLEWGLRFMWPDK